MKIYNTLTRTVEEFVPYEEGKVKFYTCGPTVYHYAHIGNMRNYIGHDILDKTLRYLGYDVKRVMNITDVGHLKSDSDSGADKMVESAKAEHKSVMDIAKFYTDAFFKDFDALNCRRPDVVSPATDNIDEYIKIINVLLDKGYAYKSGGNVYFDVSKLTDYYKLTNHKEDDMVVGVRDGVDYDDSKRNQADFALWFTKSKFEDQDLKWDSPFGTGYPGWHIECSCMARKLLGETIDIHAGGMDLKFPHHENEIAQSESLTGKKFANYWMHSAYLNINNQKMSKSLNNFFTTREILEKYDVDTVRFLLLSAHYRVQLNFSQDLLESAKASVERLYNAVSNLENLLDEVSKEKMSHDEEQYIKNLDKYRIKFEEKMDDDFNTADAISVLFELAKDLNTNISIESSKELISEALNLYRSLGKPLGLIQKSTKIS